jgi:hypothetical protein
MIVRYTYAIRGIRNMNDFASANFHNKRKAIAAAHREAELLFGHGGLFRAGPVYEIVDEAVRAEIDAWYDALGAPSGGRRRY